MGDRDRDRLAVDLEAAEMMPLVAVGTIVARREIDQRKDISANLHQATTILCLDEATPLSTKTSYMAASYGVVWLQLAGFALQCSASCRRAWRTRSAALGCSAGFQWTDKCGRTKGLCSPTTSSTMS